jgi:hypothetical protein
LTHAAETRKEISRIHVTEMIPARNVTGKPRRDSLRNEEIRNRVNTNKLQEDFEIT